MEKKLSNEEIGKVFAMYWGQKIVVRKENDIQDGKGAPVSNALSLLVLGMLKIENHALLLTPLSAISDKDAVEVAKIIVSPFWRGDNKQPELVRKDNHVMINTSGWKMVSIFYDGTIVFEEKNETHTLYTRQIILAYQYLISKGYDMPLLFTPNHWANGKTAIELGLAIEPL